MENPTHPKINCSICGKPVDLETAKTDDDGKAVHEECYVLRLAPKQATQSQQSAP